MAIQLTIFGKKRALAVGRSDSQNITLSISGWAAISPRVSFGVGARSGRGHAPQVIGTNNMKFTCTPEDIADGVAEIIRQYQKRCPNAVILLQGIFPRAALPTAPYRLKVKATNYLLAKLGDGTKNHLSGFRRQVSKSGRHPRKKRFPDLLYPNVKGYEIWANATQPKLDQYFGPR